MWTPAVSGRLEEDEAASCAVFHGLDRIGGYRFTQLRILYSASQHVHSPHEHLCLGQMPQAFEGPYCARLREPESYGVHLVQLCVANFSPAPRGTDDFLRPTVLRRTGGSQAEMGKREEVRRASKHGAENLSSQAVRFIAYRMVPKLNEASVLLRSCHHVAPYVFRLPSDSAGCVPGERNAASGKRSLACLR